MVLPSRWRRRIRWERSRFLPAVLSTSWNLANRSDPTCDVTKLGTLTGGPFLLVSGRCGRHVMGVDQASGRATAGLAGITDGRLSRSVVGAQPGSRSSRTWPVLRPRRVLGISEPPGCWDRTRFLSAAGRRSRLGAVPVGRGTVGDGRSCDASISRAQRVPWGTSPRECSSQRPSPVLSPNGGRSSPWPCLGSRVSPSADGGYWGWPRDMAGHSGPRGSAAHMAAWPARPNPWRFGTF